MGIRGNGGGGDGGISGRGRGGSENGGVLGGLIVKGGGSVGSAVRSVVIHIDVFVF